ncbi:DNA-directed RNA polymerase I subunit RPA12 [Wickerhamiella sorbophila]|uniref:DNA-directed RNA polymerase subunit n=1 Tax=Wickerhamiella sorbophila TaxID=45607 RepID=A0A2T0FEA6_9ASCO|nr:DNA-directed RNA polymerase I subunit RPA12 [Wickerhamiella sorbophila]PRT53297.1 DNA-directed RNA polymerase I subunit RPA12 [Wickerhamiella sorbophila]
MSVVGSLIFCTDCGNLLNSITEKMAVIKCDMCQRDYDTKNFEDLHVVTESAPTAFPSALRLKRSAVKTTLHDHEVEEGAVIKERCPECGNDEMRFHTLQLRSADEGATVFYTCTNCGYKTRVSN